MKNKMTETLEVTPHKTTSNTNILLVEDDSQQREIIHSILSSSGYLVTAVGSAEDAILTIKTNMQESKGRFDVVFSDWKLGNYTGMDVLNFARKNIPDVGFAIATAYGTIAHAVKAINLGADDYLAKPFQRQELLLCIEKANKARRLRQKNTQLQSELSQQQRLVELVGNSASMQRVYARIKRVSATDATVLISGESGTGKELAARALQRLSHRSNNSFIAVNCGAIPETLAEAELFGARKGAYTGAFKDMQGKLESAHQGTLFLDEVGELSLSVQTRLLRFLQEGTITRLGDTQEKKIDVRVIAASHRDLSMMVEQGTFREDLFYRLNIVPIEMPPLRERRDDIALLVDFFLKKYQKDYQTNAPKLSPPTLKGLLDFDWPGNVRELSNRIERFVLLGDEQEMLDDLHLSQQKIDNTNNSYGFSLPDDGLNWENFEKQCLLAALKKHSGNRTLAAKFLSMSYKTYVYRLNKFQES